MNKIKVSIMTVLITFFILCNTVQAVNNPSRLLSNNISVNNANTNSSVNKQNQTQKTNQTQTQEKTKSSNANLSNLGIYTYDFTGFKPNTTMYSTTVPNEVTSVEVYAIPQDKATYVISGNTNLNVGTNRVTVEVTSEDKTVTKTYYINVEREAEQKTETNSKLDEKLELISIKIDQSSNAKLDPEFSPEIRKYTIRINEDIEKIPLSARANVEGAKIEITGNENLKDGENTIIIKATRGFEEVEYKILVRKNMEDETTDQEGEGSSSNYLSYPHTQYGWYIIGGVLIIYILIFTVWIIRVKLKKKKTKKSTSNTDIPKALRH